MVHGLASNGLMKTKIIQKFGFGSEKSGSGFCDSGLGYSRAGFPSSFYAAFFLQFVGGWRTGGGLAATALHKIYFKNVVFSGWVQALII